MVISISQRRKLGLGGLGDESEGHTEQPSDRHEGQRGTAAETLKL